MNITGIRPYEAVGFYANRIESADAAVKSVNIEPGQYLNDGSQAGSFSAVVTTPVPLCGFSPHSEQHQI